MDGQIIVEASGYLALGIAAWPICKYFLGPLCVGTFTNKNETDSIKDAYRDYYQGCTKIAEQRTQITIELGKVGRNGKEISDVLEASLPFPGVPDISYNRD